MKVLFINEVCGITSTGRICTDIASLLEEQGHQCKIAYGRGIVPDKYKKYAVKIGSQADVYLHALGSRIFDNTGFYSISATKNFIKWAEQYNPDVIHLHNLHGYYINIKLLFEHLKRCGKPIVWTLHDCWSFTGHCSYYDFEGCEKWKKGCYSCQLKKEYPASIFTDRSKKNYTQKKELFTGIENLRIVTPSQWLKNQVEQSFLKEYPVSVVNNGIDLEIFKPRKSDFAEKNGIKDKIILLGVANIWAARKGLKDFIKLSEKLDDKYKLVLVGDLRGNKCPENILHIAHTNNPQELAEIYSEADVFLNLTYEDNYPTTNLESIACGTPVITYQTGGSPEAVSSNCGWVVPKGNLEALISILENTVSNGKLLVTETGDFNKTARFNEYIKLYEELI